MKIKKKDIINIASQHIDTGIKIFTLLIILVASESFAYTPPDAGSGAIDGETGEIHVVGVLQANACNINAQSRNQIINLGPITTDSLTYLGERGEAHQLRFRLTGCMDLQDALLTDAPGTLISGKILPKVHVNFVSDRDSKNPELIAVKGATGFGLRLENDRHKAISIGDPDIILKSDDNTLTYYLVPERTRGKMHEGSWQSHLYVRLSYD